MLHLLLGLLGVGGLGTAGILLFGGPTLLATVVNTVMAFLKSLPREVWYAIAAVLVAWFLFHEIDARAYKRGVAVEKIKTDAAIDALKTTRTSLGTCLGSLDDQNKAIDTFKQEGIARSNAAEQAIQSLQKDAQGAETKARALEASAAKGAPTGSCAASAAFKAVASGL